MDSSIDSIIFHLAVYFESFVEAVIMPFDKNRRDEILKQIEAIARIGNVMSEHVVELGRALELAGTLLAEAAQLLSADMTKPGGENAVDVEGEGEPDAE